MNSAVCVKKHALNMLFIFDEPNEQTFCMRGCPIPIVHCDTCGVVPEKKENLPVELPYDVSFDIPGNPLDRHPTWRNTPCPACGKDASRETDTMDTFVDSSWYFARFTAPHAATPTQKADAEYWMNVDQYIGGIEHAGWCFGG